MNTNQLKWAPREERAKATAHAPHTREKSHCFVLWYYTAVKKTKRPVVRRCGKTPQGSTLGQEPSVSPMSEPPLETQEALECPQIILETSIVISHSSHDMMISYACLVRVQAADTVSQESGAPEAQK